MPWPNERLKNIVKWAKVADLPRRILITTILLSGAVIVTGCPSEDTSSDQAAPGGRQEVEASGAPGAKILVGFTSRADFQNTMEAQVHPLESDATYHVDVRVVDDKTGELRSDVATVNIIVTGPKGDQISKPAWDLRSTFGHFCAGFPLEPRKNYRVTVTYQGALSGATTLTFSP